jgi:hypothetical protein
MATRRQRRSHPDRFNDQIPHGFAALSSHPVRGRAIRWLAMT